METNSQHLQLAIRAVSEVAQQSVVFEQAIVLRNRSNAIIHLYPSPVVARVAMATATVRHGAAWLTREVEISRYLTSVGVPVIAPSRELAPGPYQHLGLVFSFWEFFEETDQLVDAYAAGELLRICHEALRNFRGEFPVLERIREAECLLNELASTSALNPGDAEMLQRVSQSWQGRFEQLPMQHLHGDAHLGNFFNTTRGLILGDWEDTFIGPIGWDLACLQLFGLDRERADMVRSGYGLVIDQEHLDLCIEARNLCGVVWSIILNQQHPEAKKEQWIEIGLGWFSEHFSD
jgi:Phosphotransferase enzyme family